MPRFTTLAADPVRFLRTVLVLDAAASAAMGLGLLLAPTFVLDLLGLPAGLTTAAGFALLPFAVFVAWTAAPAVPWRPAVWAIVALNGLWVAESIATLAVSGLAPTALGVAFVLVQAAAVAFFAALEAAALRRAAPCPA